MNDGLKNPLSYCRLPPVIMNSGWSKPSLLRDFAVLASLIVFVLAFVSLWVTYETYLDHSERVVHQLETEATRIDRAMILEIEHSSYLLEALGREITNMDSHDLKGIARLLRSFDTTATQHHVFSWVDENQNNVVSSNSGVHPKPVDVSDRDFVKKAVADPWKIQIGRPIQGRISGKWVLPIALGLTDVTGKQIGIILISMDIGTMTHDLHNAVKDSGVTFAVYSKTFLPLTLPSEDEASKLLEQYAGQLNSDIIAKHSDGMLSTGRFFDDSMPYVYYEVSASYPYIILLSFDSRTNGASIRDLLVPRLFQIFLMGVFMLTLLWVVRVRVIKPVTELTTIAADIARGQPYLNNASGGTTNELYQLNVQLSKLSDYLLETKRKEEEKENKNQALRKGKELAELSNKIKIEFLMAMSHELRTPLNTIVGFAEMMKNQLYGPLENMQYRQYAQDIHEAARHLQSLVDDVLTLSNAEAGMLDIQEKPIDVKFILNKCLRLVAEGLQEQKLHVELKMPEILPRLLADEQRLKQIIINLLLNAAGHSIAESHIIVQAYTQKDKKGAESLCFSFINQGTRNPGNAPRPDKAIGRKLEISTLGIPLTKALVAMLQATLDIEKQAGGRVNVIVTFPPERMV